MANLYRLTALKDIPTQHWSLTPVESTEIRNGVFKDYRNRDVLTRWFALGEIHETRYFLKEMKKGDHFLCTTDVLRLLKVRLINGVDDFKVEKASFTWKLLRYVKGALLPLKSGGAAAPEMVEKPIRRMSDLELE